MLKSKGYGNDSAEDLACQILTRENYNWRYAKEGANMLWEEFKNLNFSELYNSIRKPSWLFDCRGVINKEIATKTGFKVWVVGNGT